MLRLGGPLRNPGGDPRTLARHHRELGYRAAYCPDLAIEDTNSIAETRRAFEAEGVVIAEVGAWVNILDADSEKRRKNLEHVISRLALADEVGALCCVDIAGSYNPQQWDGPHQDNFGTEFFEATVENVRAVIDAVKPKTAKFSLEMMPWALPDSADSFLALLKAVDRPAFAAHLDPVNIISSPRLYYASGDLLRECFQKLGPWIVSCHAKDSILRPGFTIHIDETRPGLGNLDYRTYLTELNRLPQKPPLMLEHLASDEEYDLARVYIQSIADEMNLMY